MGITKSEYNNLKLIDNLKSLVMTSEEIQEVYDLKNNILFSECAIGDLM